MNVEVAERPQSWGELDMAMFGLTRSWVGEEEVEPITYGMIVDHDRLWFTASHSKPAIVHPAAQPCKFHKDLWRYDCVELFIGDSKSGRYLEFNLAANGAWWSAEFKSPRRRVNYTDKPLSGIEAYSDVSKDGGWLAALAIPLEPLKQNFGFGRECRMNVAAITCSPKQKFYSVNRLCGVEPDFHQPDQFSPVHFFHSKDLPQSFR